LQIAANLFKHLKAIHFRHFDVEQKQIVRLGSKLLECNAAVLGNGDAMTHQLEIAPQQQAVDLVIVDDE
jgi:hypothetical protein